MSQMIFDTENQRWELQQAVEAAGTTTKLLQTENKFIDKNIAIKTTTAAAGAASLAVTDNTNVDVGIGTAAGGKYPVTASITGQMSFATPGWITAAGQSATDANVTVGQVDQSTLSNGNTAIVSGAEIVPGVTDQTITISEGYYDDDRTIVVKSASTGSEAEATVSAAAQATAPTLANTASAQNGKVQLTAAPATGAGTIDKYYMAVTATAPATNLEITKSVDEAGYLGSESQITASAATTANTTLFYVPVASGSVTSSISATNATAPTMANDSTATVSGKTQVTANPSTSNSGIDTFYMAVKATAPATSLTINNAVTEGYVSDAEVSETPFSTTASNSTYYIPLQSGSTSPSAGSVSATSTNVGLTESQTQPASGHYITTTGSGVAAVESGWFNASTTQASNTATKYYVVPEATFNVVGNSITATQGGYVDANTEVGTVSAGSLSTGLTSRQGYNTLSDNSVVIPTDETTGEGGYLYINAGYYGNTQISLGTLIPDQNTEDAASANILSGYEAFTTDGVRLLGTIQTYDGTYTDI
jgi:hypothetical protein